MSDPVTARRSWLTISWLLLLFAGLVLLGGSVNAGYQHSRDFVSSLAGRGSDQAWIGVLAISAYAGAHAVAARTWRHRNRFLAAALLGCALLLLTVALARASCPNGAANCALMDSPGATDAWDTVHGTAVGIYALVYLVVAVSAGVVMARRRNWKAAVTAWLLAALSVAALSQMDELTPGAEQRVWLAVNGVGLLVLVALAVRDDRRDR